MNNLDDAVAEVNRATRAAQKRPPDANTLTEFTSVFEVQPFVSLAQQLSDSIVQVYEQQLTEITNKLEEAKMVAQQIREATTRRADDINEFRQRVEIFGKAVLAANEEFRKGEQK